MVTGRLITIAAKVAIGALALSEALSVAAGRNIVKVLAAVLLAGVMLCGVWYLDRREHMRRRIGRQMEIERLKAAYRRDTPCWIFTAVGGGIAYIPANDPDFKELREVVTDFRQEFPPADKERTPQPAKVCGVQQHNTLVL